MLPIQDLARPTVPLARDLARFGDALAVVAGDLRLTYAELAARVAEAGERLSGSRRLVLVAGANEVEPLVAYLAALATGNPVLMVPGDAPRALEQLDAAYDPDVLVRKGPHGWVTEERRETSRHDLHADLALLLSTSGSTGSAKLARLSHDNVQSNAESIADYLGIRPTDCAATTLPLHYCYGLSVVHSHLLRGAGLVVTDLSVVDGCFWQLFRETRATTFAGVPYTFDLLDRVGFADMDLPHLRYVTQAGGRLDPERVRAYAELGQRRGWDLVVMYGQTEATSRMAYLPPALALSRPEAIGVAIPGGSFELEPAADLAAGVGELVYTGPNVMLGYAESPADLAAGRTVQRLHTGDLARRTPDGLIEVVGRRSRFVKLYGLRVDLQRAEDELARLEVTACCAGDDAQVVVAFEGDRDPATVRSLAADVLALPPVAVAAVRVAALPRLANGKSDYAAVRALAPAEPARATGGDRTSLRALYAAVLDRDDVTDDSTFVGLGGDSLSYVELSIALEDALGLLPAQWHTTPIRTLASLAEPRTRRWRRVETGVALRAVGITLIVGTHALAFDVSGAAHALLAVAGFNVARFHVTATARRARLRHQLTSVARIAVPTVVWIAAVALLTGQYGVANLALVSSVVGADTWDDSWHFWFVEVLLYLQIGVAVLLAVPWVDRLERRRSMVVPGVLLAAGLLTRFAVVDPGLLRTMPVLWLFALGWCAARSTTVAHRLLLTGVVAASVPGFFHDPAREAVIAAGVLALLWLPTVRVPSVLARAAGVLASASLYIYLAHWQVYPRTAGLGAPAGLLLSLAAGIGFWLAATHLPRLRTRGWGHERRGRRTPATAERRTDRAAVRRSGGRPAASGRRAVAGLRSGEVVPGRSAAPGV